MTPMFFVKAGNVAALRRWVGKVGFTEALKHVAKRFGSERAKKIVGKLKGMAHRAGELAPEHAYGATTKATMAEWLTAKPMDFGTRAESTFAAPSKPMKPTLKATGAGPGSRGGQVIGTTTSGKPIYDRFDHPAHQSFGEPEHREAAQAAQDHAGLSSITRGTNQPGRVGDALRQSLAHRREARKGELAREPAPKALPENHRRYFHHTTATQHIPLDKLHGTKGPQPQSEERAAKLMARAGAGRGTRRMPITVRPHPKKEGHFQVVDGNATHGAAKRYGWSSLPAVMAKAWHAGRFLKAAGRGEGARGGKIIGHTRSGKPIYAHAHHVAHEGFSAAEHRDAASEHDEWAKKAERRKNLPNPTSRMIGSRQLIHHQEQARQHRQSASETGVKATLSPTHEHFQQRTQGWSREQHDDAIGHHHERAGRGKPITERENAHAQQRDWHDAAIPADQFRSRPVSKMQAGDTIRHYAPGGTQQVEKRVTRVEEQSGTGMRTLHFHDGSREIDDHQRSGHDPLRDVKPGAGAMAKATAGRGADGESHFPTPGRAPRGRALVSEGPMVCKACKKAVVPPAKHCTNCGANLMLKDGPTPAEESERRELASHVPARVPLKLPPEKNPVPGAHYEPDQDQVGGPLDGDDDDRALMRKAEGSRGGQVIGHTRSGKAVYQHHNDPRHGRFSPQDHRDAAELHRMAHKIAPTAHAHGPEQAESHERLARGTYGALGVHEEPAAQYRRGDFKGWTAQQHQERADAHRERSDQADGRRAGIPNAGPQAAMLRRLSDRHRMHAHYHEGHAHRLRGGSPFSKARKPKLGTGKRFAALKEKLARRKGVRDPAAVAAAIGRKKFGKKRFAQLAKAAPDGHTFGPPGTCPACTAVAEG